MEGLAWRQHRNTSSQHHCQLLTAQVSKQPVDVRTTVKNEKPRAVICWWLFTAGNMRRKGHRSLQAWSSLAALARQKDDALVKSKTIDDCHLLLPSITITCRAPKPEMTGDMAACLCLWTASPPCAPSTPAAVPSCWPYYISQPNNMDLV
jgi:hypothetical protein